MSKKNCFFLPYVSTSTFKTHLSHDVKDGIVQTAAHAPNFRHGVNCATNFSPALTPCWTIAVSPKGPWMSSFGASACISIFIKSPSLSISEILRMQICKLESRNQLAQLLINHAPLRWNPGIFRFEPRSSRTHDHKMVIPEQALAKKRSNRACDPDSSIYEQTVCVYNIISMN